MDEQTTAWGKTILVFVGGTALPIIVNLIRDLFNTHVKATVEEHSARIKSVAEERTELFEEGRKWRESIQQELIKIQRDHLDCTKESSEMRAILRDLQKEAEEFVREKNELHKMLDDMRTQMLRLGDENARLSSENADLRGRVRELEAEVSALKQDHNHGR